MSIKRLSPEELLGLDRFNVDEGNPHIIVEKARCAVCAPRPCVTVCPARCYRLKDGQVAFDYAGCLECGTCRVVCKDKGVTSWTYPRASFGITFRCS
ncbi:ferredoxin family protein [Geothrix sp. 21YS21S-2]|uniref:ferredoxin family protein n=1 Tax=Geothrix sp. 21YS21S-2 TaxID=3068893 RepID=UPI0027B8CD56|nr:ferredoxin family protein [Geothrix sp. 21YS21S-2]